MQRSPALAATMSVMDIVAEDDKLREMVCLPLDVLNGWLFGVDVNRVKPELKEKLVRYQKECYGALFKHFFKRGLVFSTKTRLAGGTQPASGSLIALGTTGQKEVRAGTITSGM